MSLKSNNRSRLGSKEEASELVGKPINIKSELDHNHLQKVVSEPQLHQFKKDKRVKYESGESLSTLAESGLFISNKEDDAEEEKERESSREDSFASIDSQVQTMEYFPMNVPDIESKNIFEMHQSISNLIKSESITGPITEDIVTFCEKMTKLNEEKKKQIDKCFSIIESMLKNKHPLTKVVLF
jgi:hypothetical protein